MGKTITLDCGHIYKNIDYEPRLGDFNICDRCGSSFSPKYRHIVGIRETRE